VKQAEITPEFVTAMKQKGYKSKELQKYIVLKNGDTTPWLEEKINRDKKAISVNKNLSIFKFSILMEIGITMGCYQPLYNRSFASRKCAYCPISDS
jgi:hypothetical protein